MSSDQFYGAVQVCAAPEEYAEEMHLLDIIQEQDREPFVRLLCLGIPLSACFARLEEYLLTKSLVEETIQKEKGSMGNLFPHDSNYVFTVDEFLMLRASDL